MAFTSGTAAAASGHYNLFEAIRTFATGTLGWTQMRYRTDVAQITSITSVGTLATVNCAETHGQVTGASVTIAGASDANYNGVFSITYVDSVTFRYTMGGTPAASPAVGTLTAASSLTDREVIWKAPGLSLGEQIYIGMKTYQSVAGNYYNLRINAFTGYVAGNTFNTQPGRVTYNISVPLRDGSIPYYLIGNGQRLIVYANVAGTDHSFYIGKLLPYATPSQWPYPIVVGGMLPSDSATNYSDNGQIAWFKGSRNNLAMKFVDGTWRTPQSWPYQGTQTLRNTKADSNALEGVMPGTYGLHSIILSENVAGFVNNYGELDGVYYITGWSNTSGNTITISGTDYLVIGDITKVGLKDYIAIKLA